jgi:hypothetical protein
MWNFFSRAVELFQQGGGTFSAGRWNFFSKAVELFQLLGGKSSTGKSLLLSEL